jgi:endonuclease YncB( thermonuclease family)
MSGWDESKVARAVRVRGWFGWGLVFFSGIFLISIVADHLYAGGGDDWARFDGREFVVQSVDANDTLTLASSAGKLQVVHLLGVAPLETQGISPAAKQLAGKAITVKLDTTQTRDAGGRLLAYAFLNDRELINADLVRGGDAFADRREPYLLHGILDEAEADARKKRRGLWQMITEAQMPEWRKQWLAEMSARKPKLTAPPKENDRQSLAVAPHH